MLDIKVCIICGKELTGKQRTLCSEECRKKRKKEYDYEYRRNNVEKIKNYSHEYYQDNAKRIKKRNHEYCQNNLKKINGYKRKYRLNNPEKIKEKDHIYYQNNQEKIREHQREYGYKKYRLDRGLPEDADLHKESSIERIIREWLQEKNIEFIAQYYIDLRELGANWTYVDFFIEPNICLYCDGNYYHLLLNAKKCDEEQNRILPQMGYNVIRLTETEILNGVRPDLKRGIGDVK